jgi:predicted MFS family arabinose efflux permease
MNKLSGLSSELKQYLVVTGNYWAFTLTDGALRMLVVLYFHQLGYSPIHIASLFLFYELFGVVTNLLGGYLGARIGLNKTMNLGLFLQIMALLMLAVPSDYMTVVYVMAAQALSGIAKDLNKMSAKSAIKSLISDDQQNALFKWVALLTGSKNALKGVGFFLGGLLLTTIGFKAAVLAMAVVLAAVWLLSLVLLKADLGKSKSKPKFRELFSKSRAINILSAARLFLFGARDVWFVIALPVYLSQTFGWDHWWVGGYLALWIIIYGFVQTLAPKLFFSDGVSSPAKSAKLWALALAITPLLIGGLLLLDMANVIMVTAGLLVFGFIFAINSSLHSFLIVDMARSDGVSLDVGFYYMANALGRLIGTVLSGVIFQLYGIEMCLLASCIMLIAAAVVSSKLPASN